MTSPLREGTSGGPAAPLVNTLPQAAYAHTQKTRLGFLCITESSSCHCTAAVKAPNLTQNNCVTHNTAIQQSSMWFKIRTESATSFKVKQMLYIQTAENVTVGRDCCSSTFSAALSCSIIPIPFPPLAAEMEKVDLNPPHGPNE